MTSTPRNENIRRLGVQVKSALHGEGMDIFWNFTNLSLVLVYLLVFYITHLT